MDATRVFVVLAGAAGACGVGLAAAAAHVGGSALGSAAQMLLAHAPAFLGLAAVAPRLQRPGLASLAGGVLALGLALFSGTLASTAFGGPRPFAMAAPTGGTLMIAGWLAVAVAGLVPRR